MSWRLTKTLLAELPTKVIEETKQADSVQASNSEAAEEGDQGEESTLLEFIGSPYEIIDERQLGCSASYAGIIGELEITFWEENIGDISRICRRVTDEAIMSIHNIGNHIMSDRALSGGLVLSEWAGITT